MTRIAILLCLASSLVLNGCVTRDSLILDNTPRAPKQNVEVYTNGQKPTKPYKVIGTLTQLGPIQEELRAVKYFKSKAQQLGADGMVMEWPPKGEQRSALVLGTTGGVGASSGAYNFKCDLFVYDSSPSQ